MIKSKIDIGVLIITIWFVIYFGFSLCFAIFECSIENLIRVLIVGVCAITLIIFEILSSKDFNKKYYFISYNHKFYLESINIFDNSVCKKNKKCIFVKKYLEDKLENNIKTQYYNKELKIKFSAYELKDNLQLIILSVNKPKKQNLLFNPSDREKNIEQLIEKEGIRHFSYQNDIEHYSASNKRMIFSINSIEGYYCVYEWEFGIRCSSSIKKAIKYTGVEWICSRTEELFESLEEARNYALQAVETIENGKQLHYFVTYREHDPYHEFQPGKNKKLYDARGSIFLLDEIMEESKLYDFFYRVIPYYDYCGDTVVDKDTWELVKQEAQKESDVVRDLTKDMTSWADRCIECLGYFTIIGI